MIFPKHFLSLSGVVCNETSDNNPKKDGIGKEKTYLFEFDPPPLEERLAIILDILI